MVRSRNPQIPTSLLITILFFVVSGILLIGKTLLDMRAHKKQADAAELLADTARNGSDGAVIADGGSWIMCMGSPVARVYTMTRNCFFTTILVNSGTTIETENYRIQASLAIDNEGVIRNQAY